MTKAKPPGLSPPLLPQSIAAHLRYLRDLGFFDLYRRPANPASRRIAAAIIAETRREESAERPSGAPMLSGTPVRGFTPGPTTPSQTTEDADIRTRKTPPAAPPVGAYVDPRDRPEALLAVRAEIGDCQRCALSRGRNKIVFGVGDPNARLMFVGEGPGAEEDAQGLPFVGRAGQLLDNMIGAMGLRREQVYIANIVKCRPPQNRVPEPEEAQTCSPFLFRQIDVVRPEVLVALGSTAALYLLGVKSSLSGLRGRLHSCRGAKLIVTYHPAFLLRDPRQKKEAWRDLQMAMAELGLKPSSK